ncbi:PEP-CTERM sorting domain-containing protein [Lacipirellula sp.]|uniref:PEP-CTERM sorting domain-containing protein n=1 Tax=Lacipirellula sp. TaxID=2691419 RepID=UPI003D0FEAE3
MRNPVFIATAAIALAAASAHGAVIQSQGFEGTPTQGWGYALTGTGGSVSNESLAADTPASSRVRSGSYSFQHSATAASVQASTLTFDSVSLTDYEDVAVELRLASISKTSGNGNDNADLVQVFVALDGAAFSATPDLTVEGNANARWSFTSGTGVAEVTVGTPVPKFQPAGGASRTTDGYSKLLLNIPDSAASFTLKVVGTNNATGEIWAIDDVSVSGTLKTVPEPASLGLLMLGGVATVVIRRRMA